MGMQGCKLTTDSCLDFWGPASNFGIPLAAVMDTQKDPEMYVGRLELKQRESDEQERPADRSRAKQHLRPHDSSFNRLLRNFHALLHGRNTQELPSIRLPRGQLQRTAHARIPVC
jgi:hypothetical protein